MSIPTEHARRGAPARLSLVVAAALALACGERGADATKGVPGAGSAARRATGPDRYTVRGEVVRLPSAGAEPRELSIRHEPVQDFKDKAGAVVGMGAMVMPFRVAAGLSLDGLEKGDKIRFRFVMDWERNSFQIESMEELPRETALDFRAR